MATARCLRERYLAPHHWIAARLNMDGAGSVQTLVSRHRRESKKRDVSWELLESYEILDYSLLRQSSKNEGCTFYENERYCARE